MKVRLVAYRRENTGSDTYDLDQFELDLQKDPNVVVNYNWLDLKDPSQRKSSFSQTLKLPFSNANNKFFENYFDVNLDTLVFNAKFKFPAIMYIDSIPQLKGYIQLKSIYLNARLYEVALFGDTADFFTDLKDNKLKDAFRTQDTTNSELFTEDNQLDHILTLQNILNSWSTGLTTVAGTTTNDIMYPVIDYGHTINPFSSAMFWNPEDIFTVVNQFNGNINDALNTYGMVQASNLKPAIRIQRLLHIIAQKSGYQIKSSFLGIDDTNESTPITDTQFFSRIFMTLSTEHSRVQALFNTSSGSESPFIGFEVNMSSSQQSTITVTSLDEIPLVGTTFDNLIVNNEIYDPNQLYKNNIQDWEVPAIDSLNTPSIKFPTSDATMLPTGTMLVNTTFTVNIDNLTDGGQTVNAMYCYPKWRKQSTNEEITTTITNGVLINTNENVNVEFNADLPVIAGEIYYLTISFINWDSSLFSGTQDVDVTISACTIRTLQTDNVGLMSGGLNGEVQMYHNMPDMSQADFVKDLINRFNLVVQTDPENEKLLLIEPYQDFIAGGSVNYWTDKLDLSKEQVVKTTNELQSKVLKFGDLEDEDILNQRYKEIYNIVYGTYVEKRRNDFANNEFSNFSVFSPFIAQGIGQWVGNTINGSLPSADVAIAYLFKALKGETRSPLETMKPRLFYYSGTPIDITGSNPNTGNNFSFNIYSNQFIQTGDSLYTGNKFPLCLQYNLDTLGQITANTQLLNWTYYSPNFNTGFTFNYFGMTYSERGFFNDYWAKYINEIYSDEARMMECYVNLSPTDIESFAGNGFKNTYFIKNCLWRVISIDNYLVGGNKSTKVTLLKVIEKLKNDCGATPTITNTGLMTWVDSGTGASTTITNSCCEEVNPDWTFVQTNASTGEGDCYTSAGVTDFAFDTTNNTSINSVQFPMPSLMPNLQTNYNIITTNGNAYTTTYYMQGTTLDNTTVTNFNYNGIQGNMFNLPVLSMSYIKVSLLGSIVTGTNSSKCGYFEYDTILINRDNTNSQVGSAGGTLLKTNKESAFSTPTVSITNFDNRGYFSPTIIGGANERVHWVGKVEVIQQPIGDFDNTFSPTSRAIYQNAENILMQNLDYLIWN